MPEAKLTEKHCVPCEGGVPPLSHDEVTNYLAQVAEGWEPVGDTKIRREFSFKDFKEAIAFVGKVAEIAETEGHHPDLHIHYRRVGVELWTHAINGLSENDFILAAKIDAL
jgi:4a-hydroxytetrahydrobiopterin dehydratase